MKRDEIDRLIESIKSTWATEPRVMYVCLRILDWLVQPPIKSYISWGMLVKVGSSAPEDEADLPVAVQYLLGDRAHALDLCFEIMDSAGRIKRLSPDEAKDAIEHSINPLTGEFEETIQDQIMTFFCSSTSIQQNKKGEI